MAIVEGATDLFGAFAVATKLCELNNAYVSMPDLPLGADALHAAAGLVHPRINPTISTSTAMTGTSQKVCGDDFGSLLGRRKSGREQVARWTTYAFTKLLPAVELVLGSSRAGMVKVTKTNVDMVTVRSTTTELVDYRLKRFPVEVLRLDDALRKRKSLSCCGPTGESNINQCVITLADLAMFV
jgi:hypothetical protein